MIEMIFVIIILQFLSSETYPHVLRNYFHFVISLNITYHFPRGPCESGLLFAYNHTSDATQCLCNKNLVNFYPETGQCFQFDTKGPCRKGQMFQYSKMIGRGECLCRKGKVSSFECHFP